MVGSVAHRIAQYCVRNCSLQICYAATLPTKVAADKAVSALPVRLLGSVWSSVHGVHAEIARRSLPARTLGIAPLFCYAFSSQYPKLLAPYPSASSISSGLTVSSYSSLLNERHNGSHLHQFFSCETTELWHNRLQDFRKCKLIGQFETNFVQVLLDPPLPSAFPLFHFRGEKEGLHVAARLLLTMR